MSSRRRLTGSPIEIDGYNQTGKHSQAHQLNCPVEFDKLYFQHQVIRQASISLLPSIISPHQWGNAM